MKRESVVFSIVGMFFGVLIGWMIGSQQARQAAPPSAAASAAPAAASPSSSSSQAPPLDTLRASNLERTANGDPSNVSVRIELADLYFDAERFDLATPWYEAALKLDPKNVNVSTDLGVCYYYLNQVDRALAQLDHSLAIDPKHSKTLLNQGIVRAFGKQDFKGAVESWQKVMAMSPGTPEAQQAKQGLDGIFSSHPELKPDGRGGDPSADPGRA
jgi:cytochrome c-type biogenesis protein CcmH/NrfG